MKWWTKSWNPVVGCTPVSPGCEHCYAKALHDQRRKALLAGKRIAACYAQPFEQVTCLADRLDMPLHWRKPQMVFVNSMTDMFHPAVPFAFLDRIFAAMFVSRHTFMLLTKRPERMREYILSVREEPIDTARDDAIFGPMRSMERAVFKQDVWPLPNVWLGATICNQPEADKNIPILLDTPAAKRFVSVEPMLGAVDLGEWVFDRRAAIKKAMYGPWALNEYQADAVIAYPLDWIICGGETGPGARPMHPDWVRSLRDQCASAGVPFFFKQWGGWAPNIPDLGYDNPAVEGVAWGTIGRNGEWHPETTPFSGDKGEYEWPMSCVGKHRAGRLLDGREWNEIPGVER